MLTRKQHQLLNFINDHLNKNGISPSFDEMKAALDLRSKSGVHRLIVALEERGFIRRLAHKARALEVLRLPEDAGPNIRVIEGGFQNSQPAEGHRGETLTLPLFGRIAAGQPIEALSDPDSHIDVPTSMLNPGGEHFALEVVGDSMVEAGILEGDVAVIRRADNAENGAIVVALVDREEATLKRLRRRGQSVALEPANKAYETRILPPNRVKVQGRMVALLRRY